MKRTLEEEVRERSGCYDQDATLVCRWCGKESLSQCIGEHCFARTPVPRYRWEKAQRVLDGLEG